jgi:signal transduction histidine kinase
LNFPIISVPIQHEQDVVLARRRARQIAELLRFDAQEQVRVATAVSEIARNAFTYAGGGRAEFSVEMDEARAAFAIRIVDDGPGIADLETILNGSYHSRTGMGMGILGARRLMDSVQIDSHPGNGTAVKMSKDLPQGVGRFSSKSLAGIVQSLAREPQDVFEEVRNQNRDLLRALDEVRHAKAELEQRQEQLLRLNRELEETNRGVVALYAELDERAERLRHADTMKSRFLSYVSHEFRTPLNGIMGLARLLLGRHSVQVDAEAQKQVRFMQKAALELSEMVNDLLDLAKVEAGKFTVQAVGFSAETLMGTLRSLFRPLQPDAAVALIFDVPDGVPLLHTDETKLAQILRNLLSNALKFTEKGEVRVTVTHDAERDLVVFSVKDTGIGIAPAHQSVIFEEFSQIENSLQKRTKGTGLGLPLCKRLCELLGGTVSLESAPGLGSTFTVSLPRVYGAGRVPRDRKVLIVDDEEISRYLLRTLMPAHVEILEAAGGTEAIRMARECRPDLVFLDLIMPDISGSEVLRELRCDPATQSIPIVIATSRALDAEERDAFQPYVTAIFSKDILARSAGLRIDFGPPAAVWIMPGSVAA